MVEKPTINTKLTTRNFSSGHRPWKYIAMHYTANNGDTALANCNYFYTVYREASAHFFIDENSIWQCVSLDNTAWHVGANKYNHPYARNSNTIGIEMCSRKDANGKYYIKDAVVENAKKLVKWLMQEYNIPVSNVIRHYDVMGKVCPEPWVRNPELFENFKTSLTTPDHWARVYADKAFAKGWITDKDYWYNFDGYTTKSCVLALLDKISGGTWTSAESDASIHWVQPTIISLMGKKVITDKNEWLTNPDAPISKALFLALICNMKGGVSDLYKNRKPDHWARNCLDTLCDLGIVKSPQEWCDCFEGQVSRGMVLAMCCKAFGA